MGSENADRAFSSTNRTRPLTQTRVPISSSVSSAETSRRKRLAARNGYPPIPAVRDGEQPEVKSLIILRLRLAALIDGPHAPRAVMAGWNKYGKREGNCIELIRRIRGTET